MKPKRVINMRVLPGQPLDGSGQVCIHLFVKDDHGSFVEPCVTCMVEDEEGRPRLSVRPSRGRLACDPKRSVASITRDGVTTITHRSDDPRAVTCPKCKASEAYRQRMELLTVHNK